MNENCTCTNCDCEKQEQSNQESITLNFVLNCVYDLSTKIDKKIEGNKGDKFLAEIRDDVEDIFEFIVDIIDQENGLYNVTQ